MIKIIIVTTVFFLIACTPSFEITQKDRAYIRKIQVESLTFEWFFYSSAYTETSPDYVLVSKNGRFDTLLKSNNIAHLDYKNDTIFLSFYDGPQLYGKPINIKKEIFGKKIIIDTLAQLPIKYKPRKTFQLK